MVMADHSAELLDAGGRRRRASACHRRARTWCLITRSSRSALAAPLSGWRYGRCLAHHIMLRSHAVVPFFSAIEGISQHSGVLQAGETVRVLMPLRPCRKQPT